MFVGNDATQANSCPQDNLGAQIYVGYLTYIGAVVHLGPRNCGCRTGIPPRLAGLFLCSVVSVVKILENVEREMRHHPRPNIVWQRSAQPRAVDIWLLPEYHTTLNAPPPETPREGSVLAPSPWEG